MNVKNTCDQKRDEFLSVEQDLILFLKNAKKEEINTVIDTLKIAYDVDNDLSVLAAAYAFELDLMTNMDLPDKKMRQLFLQEHPNLFYEAVTVEDYQTIVNNGAVPNDNVYLALKSFEETQVSFNDNYKTEYIPSSSKLTDISNRMSEILSDLLSANLEYNWKITHYKNNKEDSVLYFFMSILCFAYSAIGWRILHNDLYYYAEYQDTLLIYSIMWISVVLTMLFAILYILVPFRFIYTEKISDIDWILESVFSHRAKLLVVDLFLVILSIIVLRS